MIRALNSRLVAFVSSTLAILVALVALSNLYAKEPWQYAPKAISTQLGNSKCPYADTYHCEDPYRRPGYLYIDPRDYKHTRWVPYTDMLFNAPDPEAAQYPAAENADLVFSRTGPAPQFIEAASTPRSWFKVVINEVERRKKAFPKASTVEDFDSMKDGGDLGWLWGRRALFLSDSIDRWMMIYFCQELGYELTQPTPHTTATCVVPPLNLTLVHWHYAGSFTYRPDWWWMDDMKEIAFEDRWETIFRPIQNETLGPNGRPDLLLWQNGLWDERALWENAEAHYKPDQVMGQRERQLIWQEVRFIAARVKKHAEKIQEEFGPGLPTMFRAFTVHRESNAIDSNLYELDRISRAVAEMAGHEIFEWARILSGFSMLYQDQLHLGKGPASWLWGNMILEYLARSAGRGDDERKPYFDGWDACHSQLVHWGGR